MIDSYRINIKNELDELATVSQKLEELTEKWEVDMGIAMNLSLCLEEALTNVIFYAYPKGESGDILVTFQLESGSVSVGIEDEGIAFNPLTDSKEPDLEASIEDRQIGGLGIHFIKQFMDKLDYQRINNKNQIVFSKKI